MPEQRMDGGWGRFVSKVGGGQVWMWRGQHGWFLNGSHFSDREVEADYEPAPLTVLSDEVREYLKARVMAERVNGEGPVYHEPATVALASMGLGPDGKPLPAGGQTMPYRLIEVTATLVTKEWVLVEGADGDTDEYARTLANKRWEDKLEGGIYENGYEFTLVDIETKLLSTQSEVPDTVFITKRDDEIVEVEP